jgi:hypothetical protein
VKWYLDPVRVDQRDGGPPCLVIRDAAIEGEPWVAKINPWFVGDTERAEKILQAVNVHDELVAACKALVEARGTAFGMVERTEHACELARAALSRAGVK